MRQKGSLTAMEAICLTTLVPGDSFFSYKKDKDITAIASYYKIKIATERITAIDSKTNSTIEKITKVTLL